MRGALLSTQSARESCTRRAPRAQAAGAGFTRVAAWPRNFAARGAFYRAVPLGGRDVR